MIPVADTMTPQQRIIHETNSTNHRDKIISPHSKNAEVKMKILWLNVVLIVILHVAAVYGAYLFFVKAMWSTCFFSKYLCLLILVYSQKFITLTRSDAPCNTILHGGYMFVLM